MTPKTLIEIHGFRSVDSSVMRKLIIKKFKNTRFAGQIAVEVFHPHDPVVDCNGNECRFLRLVGTGHDFNHEILEILKQLDVTLRLRQESVISAKTNSHQK